MLEVVDLYRAYARNFEFIGVPIKQIEINSIDELSKTYISPYLI